MNTKECGNRRGALGNRLLHEFSMEFFYHTSILEPDRFYESVIVVNLDTTGSAPCSFREKLLEQFWQCIFNSCQNSPMHCFRWVKSPEPTQPTKLQPSWKNVKTWAWFTGSSNSVTFVCLGCDSSWSARAEPNKSKQVQDVVQRRFFQSARTWPTFCSFARSQDVIAADQAMPVMLLGSLGSLGSSEQVFFFSYFSLLTFACSTQDQLLS